jgi:ribokinase
MSAEPIGLRRSGRGIVVVGSINMDMTLYLTRWPEIGETVTASDLSVQLGGKGANQAIAAARLGAEVTMIAGLGDDAYGSRARAELVGEGITLHAPPVAGIDTGLAIIDVGPDGRNIIRLSPGANAALTGESIAAQAAAFGACKVVLLQNEIPLAATLAAAKAARGAGALVICDPAPAPEQPWGPEILAQFDIVTPNLHEARLLSGLTTAAPAMVAQALAGQCGRGAIVTMGEDGVVWHVDGVSGQAPACPVQAIDTVAAGDCFNGALATGLLQDMPLGEAISFASHAAALATTCQGAAASLPRLHTVLAFKATGALI